ncbi:DUF5955 family protein [Streptomyces venezuelae]|uniref:Uncharacterized protein n=1 Tax=Streptomyces venezuelae TaxID=54571 RepID=A0A5P2BSH8_STRVZ|nr:DUF5955 family protein [Streptomyces venezuelae]QES33432.1 hypothetical protein DEJ48_08550 [Streptomyces venezuelae]
MNAGNFEVGDVKGNGIAVGHGAHAAVNVGQPVRAQEALDRFDDLVRVLERHADELPEPGELRRPLALVRAELAGGSPDRFTLGSLLAAIGASVGGVAVIAEAVDRLQQAVVALF